MELKKFLKIFIFVIIVFLTPNVFATETNVSSKIKYSIDYTGGTYNGDEIALGGYSGPYSIGTRYNGRLSMLSFYLSSNDYDFLINHTYSITLNMATQDWRNHFMGPQVLKVNSDGSFVSTNGSLSVSNFRFVSYKQIKFNFTTNNSISPYYFFRLYSSDYASNNTIAITGDNNWSLSSVIINDQVSTSGSGSSGSSGAGSSINNNTLSCNDGLTITSTTYNDSNANITGSYINSSGNLVSNVGYNVINYIPIKPNTNYQIKKTTSTGDVPSYCLSNSTTSYGSCTAYNSNSTFTFNSGNNSYLSLSIKPDETIYLSYCASSIEIDNQNTQNIIDNANQNTTDIIDNNNQNTNKIVDELKKCRDSYNLFDENLFLNAVNWTKNSDGYYNGLSNNLRSYLNNNHNIISYKNNTQYTFKYTSYNGTATNTRFFIFYTDGTYSETYINRDTDVHTSTFTSTAGKTIDYLSFGYFASGTYFIKDFIISEGSISRPYEKYGEQVCTNRLDDTTNAINDVNDSLNNSNIDSGVGSDFFDDFETNDFGFSDIIKIPLTTIQQLTSTSCVNIQIPIPFTNSTITLPCMTTIYQTYMPTVFSIWQTVSFGIIAYYIVLDLFRMVKGFKDPESDKVEVLDL